MGELSYQTSLQAPQNLCKDVVKPCFNHLCFPLGSVSAPKPRLISITAREAPHGAEVLGKNCRRRIPEG